MRSLHKKVKASILQALASAFHEAKRSHLALWADAKSQRKVPGTILPVRQTPVGRVPIQNVKFVLRKGFSTPRERISLKIVDPRKMRTREPDAVLFRPFPNLKCYFITFWGKCPPKVSEISYRCHVVNMHIMYP